MKSKLYPIAATITGLPFVAFAAGPTLSDMIYLIISYLNMGLVLMMGFAVVIFIYYVIKYFILPNENRSEAGAYVLYSVIGFFVILSFWGIVNVLQNTFGLQNDRNRPASWASFSNLFPRGSSSGTNNNNVGPFNNPGGNSIGPFNNDYVSGSESANDNMPVWPYDDGEPVSGSESAGDNQPAWPYNP